MSIPIHLPLPLVKEIERRMRPIERFYRKDGDEIGLHFTGYEKDGNAIKSVSYLLIPAEGKLNPHEAWDS